MKLKTDVKLTDLQPQIVLGVVIVNSIFLKHQLEMVITSAFEGTHMANSKHYTGEAVDIRTRDISLELLSIVVEEINVALGNDFDVVLENDPPHLHIEFDPKG